MDKIVLSADSMVTVDDNNAADVLHYQVSSDCSMVLEIRQSHQCSLQLTVDVDRDARFTMLILNRNSGHVNLTDTYNLYQGSNAVIAYSQLNLDGLTTSSQYNLLESHASVHTLSASISSGKNYFEQNCVHLSSQTRSDIDNYGIVLKNGHCQMVVKSTINKGYHDCVAHQTSRLLTYDKTSYGKILPILYIDDNQVEASHACSMGQPDSEQLYYLQSRGLTGQQALQLISLGYLLPITRISDDEKLNEILKAEIEEKVSAYV